jgi:hypothetical protein
MVGVKARRPPSKTAQILAFANDYALSTGSATSTSQRAKRSNFAAAGRWRTKPTDVLNQVTKNQAIPFAFGGP